MKYKREMNEKSVGLSDYFKPKEHFTYTRLFEIEIQ